ncbi:hypothetical protein D3C73_1568250 [compost metagenome]
MAVTVAAASSAVPASLVTVAASILSEVQVASEVWFLVELAAFRISALTFRLSPRNSV